MRNMSETWMKQMNKLQSDLEMVQMREKQAEFGNSNAGVFFDAIFKNKIEILHFLFVTTCLPTDSCLLANIYDMVSCA